MPFFFTKKRVCIKLEGFTYNNFFKLKTKELSHYLINLSNKAGFELVFIKVIIAYFMS